MGRLHQLFPEAYPMHEMQEEIENRLRDDLDVFVLVDLLARAAVEAIDKPGVEDMLHHGLFLDHLSEAIWKVLQTAVADYLNQPEQQMNVQTWWHQG